MPDELNRPDAPPIRGDLPEASKTEVLLDIADHVLIRCIGRGAYGEVWLGRNAVGGLHAVKVVSRKTFSDDRAFHREFEGLRKFGPISSTHPGFIHILHVGERFAEGYFYYVMELADDARTGQFVEPATYVARTLAHELTTSQRLPLATSLPIGLELASALAKLHEHKFIHRDIKPSNIIFVKGVPKIADIGLVTEQGEEVTDVCTLPYRPLEGHGKPTGDIFSLGKVFYQLFMGQPVKSFPEVPGAAEEFTTHPALQQLNQLILKACDPNPGRRFQTANELHDALVSVTETVQGKRPSTEAAPPARGVAEGKALWTRRTALLALGGAITGGAFLFMNRREPVGAAPSGGPVIFLMDTVAPRGVYDSDNIRKGRSNADELLERLAGLDGTLSLANLNKEAIGLAWARDSFVAAKRPDIVIIHRSSFFHPFAAQLSLPYPPFDTKEELDRWEAIYDSQDARLRAFIRSVGAVVPHTQFLIYSTGTDQRWLNSEYRANWAKTLELELPTPEERIQVMFIRPRLNEPKGTFRNEQTMEEVRTHVREMIKKLKKRKDEKAK